MPHLSEHTRDLTRILVLGGTPDPAEPERAQGAAVALGLADLAAYLPDDELRHQLSSFSDPAAGSPGGSSAASAPVAASVAAGSGAAAALGAAVASGSAAAGAGASTSAGASSASCSTGLGTGRISATVLPRMRATSSGRRSVRRPTTVARARLIG